MLVYISKNHLSNMLTISEAAYKVVRIKVSEKQATFSYNGSEK